MFMAVTLVGWMDWMANGRHYLTKEITREPILASAGGISDPYTASGVCCVGTLSQSLSWYPINPAEQRHLRRWPDRCNKKSTSGRAVDMPRSSDDDTRSKTRCPQQRKTRVWLLNQCQSRLKFAETNMHLIFHYQPTETLPSQKTASRYTRCVVCDSRRKTVQPGFSGVWQWIDRG